MKGQHLVAAALLGITLLGIRTGWAHEAYIVQKLDAGRAGASEL
ncbi:hypothetical protein ACTEPL_000867 [Cronobacter sakazakii]